jgi:hypothetical protein
MKIELKVDYLDGTTKDVDAVFADFISFERTWNRSVTKFDEELRLTDLGWLAWHAFFRMKQVAIPFDPDWIGLVEMISVRETDEGEIPLDKAQPIG